MAVQVLEISIAAGECFEAGDRLLGIIEFPGVGQGAEAEQIEAGIVGIEVLEIRDRIRISLRLELLKVLGGENPHGKKRFALLIHGGKCLEIIEHVGVFRGAIVLAELHDFFRVVGDCAALGLNSAFRIIPRLAWVA